MTANRAPRVVKSMRKQPFKGRGQIYKWLRKWHRHLVDAFEETEAGWAVVVNDMILDGVIGSRGEPPNPKSAAKVWSRVCRDVAAAERKRLTGLSSKQSASRAAPGWLPPVVPAAKVPHQPPVAGPAQLARSEPAPFAPKTANTELGTSDPYSPERLKAGFLETVAKRSGR